MAQRTTNIRVYKEDRDEVREVAERHGVSTAEAYRIRDQEREQTMQQANVPADTPVEQAGNRSELPAANAGAEVRQDDAASEPARELAKEHRAVPATVPGAAYPSELVVRHLIVDERDTERLERLEDVVTHLGAAAVSNREGIRNIAGQLVSGEDFDSNQTVDAMEDTYKQTLEVLAGRGKKRLVKALQQGVPALTEPSETPAVTGENKQDAA